MILDIYPNASATAEALIQYILQQLKEKGDAPLHIAFSGGGTPTLLFDIWAKEYKDATPWERLRFYWVDERCVPADDEQSNYGTMKQHLLSRVPMSPEHIYSIDGTNDPTTEAQRYAQLVREQLPKVNGQSSFDIVQLGAGDDGHTSSIFPGQTDLLTTEAYYAASRNPYSGQLRVALTAKGILAAQKVVFLITGSNKQPVVRAMMGTEDTGPAAYMAHHHEDVMLFLDEAAKGTY